MKKVPLAFKNTVRKVYFDLMRRILEEENLTLDLEHYKDDTIVHTGHLIHPEVVAIIYSHSLWGEPDDLTNEFTPRGLNGRKYDGLKIIIKNNRFRNEIEKVVNNMRRQLDEDVVIEEMSNISVVFG